MVVIPKPLPTKWDTIRSSFLRFRRHMYTKYFFRSSPSSKTFPFRVESCWDPPIPDNSNLVAYMFLVLDSIRSSTRDMYDHHIYPNLSQDELSFLTNFTNDPNYLIKPADKGGVIVVWSSHDYIAEAHSQLNNNLHYDRIDNDPNLVISHLSQEINSFLIQFKKFFDNQNFNFLKADPRARIPSFIYYRKFINPSFQADPSPLVAVHQQILETFSLTFSWLSRKPQNYHVSCSRVHACSILFTF